MGAPIWGANPANPRNRIRRNPSNPPKPPPRQNPNPLPAAAPQSPITNRSHETITTTYRVFLGCARSVPDGQVVRVTTNHLDVSIPGPGEQFPPPTARTMGSWRCLFSLKPPARPSRPSRRCFPSASSPPLPARDFLAAADRTCQDPASPLPSPVIPAQAPQRLDPRMDHRLSHPRTCPS